MGKNAIVTRRCHFCGCNVDSKRAQKVGRFFVCSAYRCRKQAREASER